MSINFLRRTYLCAILVLMNFAPGFSQWAQTNGPPGGSVHAMTAIGSTIFTGTHGGIFRSTDNGESWLFMSTGLSNPAVYSLAHIGSTLFAGTFNDGVIRSTDLGETWTSAKTGLTSNYVRALAVSDTLLFAGTYYGGVCRSTNNGSNWYASDSGPTIPYVLALIAASNGSGGTNLFAGTWQGGVFRSTDGGRVWSADTSGLTSKYVESLVASPNGAGGMDIFAGTEGGVFLSTNHGSTWKNTDLQAFYVSALAVSGANLYAGTEGSGIFRSTDHGSSWNSANTGLTDQYVYALAGVPNGAADTNLFAGTGTGGVFVSADNGALWSNANLPDTYIYALAAVGTTLFAGSEYGCFRSTDNGSTWKEATNVLTHSSVRALKAIANGSGGYRLIAGTGGDGVFVTTDDGGSWVPANNGLTATFIKALAENDTLLFCGTGGGVFRSTNDGTTWSEANSGLANSNVQSLTVNSNGPGGARLFAGTYYGGVYRSTNNGSAWTPSSSGLSEDIRALAVNGVNLYAATGHGVYISTDDGDSWSHRGLQQYNLSSLIVYGENIFAGTGDGGLFRSTELDTAWEALQTGLPNLEVLAMEVSGAYLTAGTYGSGVWKRPLTELTTVDEEHRGVGPASFDLGQNFPNPFNPTTILSFAIGHSSFVRLKVFDLTGRELATLVNEQKEPGTYDVKWDASGYASGVYYYRLEAGGFSKARKLLLLK